MARPSKKKSEPKAAAKKRNTSTKAKSGSPKPAKSKTSDATTKSVATVLQPSWFKRWRRRLVKLISVMIVLMIAVPLLLTLVYSSSAVHPVSTLMISHWVSGKNAKRDWVPLEKISPFIVQSVISSEDGQFCAHSGVDWNAANLVVDDLIEGERPRGASTIPMQTVKNLYLWSSRSYLRKGLEVPLALMVDAVWSKKRLLEIYLNIAEWGPGIFGIEAAARHHFKRSAKSLSRRQAALLAVTLPNPKLRNPRKPRRGMRRLARLVERRAKQSGAYIKCVR